MFGGKSKRAEKKAKREVAKNKAKENPIIAILSGDGMLDHMILRKKTIIHTQSGDGEKPLAGVVARIESGRELESRITLTRIALLGAFAIAAPKRKGGEKFVSIEGPDFIWWMEVDRKRTGDAARFVAKVNRQVKEGAQTMGDSEPDTLAKISDDIEAAKNWCDGNGEYGTGVSSVTEHTLGMWADRIRNIDTALDVTDKERGEGGFGSTGVE